MKKLKIPSNLTSLAYKSIKDYILVGRLDEDSRLTEEFLSSQLGISKSPIREALNRLEAEGLIRIEARRGAYLRSFSVKEVADLYNLREALETHAVRTGNFSSDLFEELHKSVKRLREYLKQNEKVKYIDEDMSFHASLVGATGNARLCDVLENLQNQIWLFRRKTYDISSSAAAEYHEKILDALEAGDRQRAEKTMSEHISEVRKKLIDFLVRQQHEEPSTKQGTALNRADGRPPLPRVAQRA